MVWSNWKWALAAAAVCGGLAWSQIPSTRSSGGKSERILTVNEGGKAIRCRVISTWTMADGSTAHQLQALDTGEMMTIVDDGPAAWHGTGSANKVKVMPQRIFHWGRNKTPPPGTPIPPEIIPASAQVISSPAISSQGVTPGAPTPIYTGPERVISWEAGTSKPGVVGASNPELQPTSGACPPTVADGGQACDPCCTTSPVSARRPLFQPGSRVRLINPYGGPTSTVVSNPRPIMPATTVVQGNAMPAGGEILWEKYIDPVTGKEVVNVPSKTRSQPIVEKQPRKFGDRLANLFGPKQRNTKPAHSGPIEPRPIEVAEHKPAAKPGQAFSTAAPATPPPAGRPKALPLSIADEQPAKIDPKQAPTPVEPTKNERPWRDMWGKSPDSKLQQPGQSLVEPSPAKVPPSSVTEKKKDDILLQPEKFNQGDNRITPKSGGVPAGQALQTQTQLTNPQIPGNWPIGAQSVLAAKNGHMNGITYIPVPIATVPNPLKLPAPPEPKLPEPPAPNAWVNAFTAPPKQQQDQQQMQAIVNQQMGGQQGLPTHGYTPIGQPVMANQPQRPLNYMANYQGPKAPNPFGQQQPVVPVQYLQPAGPAPYAPQQGAFPTYVSPAGQATQPAAAQVNEAVYLQQLVSVLRESPYPAQREWAANTLSTFDWRAHPQIVQVLIQAARQDAAATVRAGCVYSLARMNANLEPVTTTFQTLREDADPRVRQEAEQALARFKQ